MANGPSTHIKRSRQTARIYYYYLLTHVLFPPFDLIFCEGVSQYIYTHYNRTYSVLLLLLLLTLYYSCIFEDNLNIIKRQGERQKENIINGHRRICIRGEFVYSLSRSLPLGLNTGSSIYIYYYVPYTNPLLYNMHIPFWICYNKSPPRGLCDSAPKAEEKRKI